MGKRNRIAEPDLGELIHIVNTLSGKYEETNISRVAFHQLVLSVANDKTLADEKKHRLLMGFFILELEIIKQVEYSGKTPSVKEIGVGIFKKKVGSTMYTYIKHRLGINTNPLTKVKTYLENDRRMVYLNEVYKELNDNPKKYSVYFNAKATDANTLLETVEKRLIDLKDRSDRDIRVLTEGKPSLETLYRYVEEKNKAYKDIVKQRSTISYCWTDSNHQKLLDFVDFIAQTSKYLDKVHDDMSPQEKALKIDEAANVVIAAYLFLLLEIRGKYWVFSPEGTYLFGYKISGSKAYEDALSAINKSNLQNVTDEERIELLIILFNRLSKIQTLLKLNDPQHAAVIAEWKNKGFDNVASFKKAVLDSLVLQQAQRSKTWTASIINGTVHTGLGVSVAGIVAKVGLPVISAIAISNPITFAITGALLFTPLGMSLATKGLSYASDKTIGAVSDKITGATLNVIDKAKERVDYLFKGEYVKQDDEEYSEWKKMLLELPEKFITKREHQAIEDFLGSEEVARLKAYVPNHNKTQQVSITFTN